MTLGNRGVALTVVDLRTAIADAYARGSQK